MNSNKDLNAIMNGIYSKIKMKSFKVANIIVGCLSLCFLICSFIFEKTNRSIFTAFLVLAVLCWIYLIFYGFTRLILSIFANAISTQETAVGIQQQQQNDIKNTLQQHNFVTTNEVGFEKSKILIDTNSKQWSIQDGTKDGLSIREVRKLADILSFEIVDNSTTVYKTRVEGGLTRAIIGGAMFGGVGAIVGANTASSSTSTQTNNAYKVLFTVNDINNPTVEFDCSNDLSVAQKIVSTFEVIKYNS